MERLGTKYWENRRQIDSRAKSQILSAQSSLSFWSSLHTFIVRFLYLSVKIVLSGHLADNSLALQHAPHAWLPHLGTRRIVVVCMSHTAVCNFKLKVRHL